MTAENDVSPLVLGCITVAALAALFGLTAVAGFMGFGFGIVLLGCGFMIAHLLDDLSLPPDQPTTAANPSARGEVNRPEGVDG